MKQIWDITRTRGMVTQVIWNRQPSFDLRGLTLLEHSQQVSTLEELIRAFSGAELKLAGASGRAQQLFGRLAGVNVRVAGVIDGALEPGEELRGQLKKVYGIVSGRTEEAELRRARLVQSLWGDFNALQQEITPPKGLLTLAEGESEMGVAEFSALLGECIAAQTAETGAEKNVTDARAALEKLHAQVDRNNKRWYRAWTKLYPVDTPEGDAARSQIRTLPSGHRAEPVDIAGLEALTDGRVAVTYGEGGGQNAKVLELMWRQSGAEKWESGVALERLRQVAGPFPAGMRMEFRTRAAKSRGRSRWSATREVVVGG